MKMNFNGVPCSGYSVFTEIMTWEEATPYLALCAECPLRKECLQVVNPVANWSDGIVGGYLFLNGKPLTKEYERLHPLKKPYADHETLRNYITEKQLNND